jgi:hypothetical protein
MAYRLAHDLNPSERDPSATSPIPSAAERPGTRGSLTGGAAGSKMDEDEERDAVFYRLETLGYRVGQGLVER